MRRDRFDASFDSQPLVQPVAVIGFFSDQTVEIVGEEAVVDRLFDEGDASG